MLSERSNFSASNGGDRAILSPVGELDHYSVEPVRSAAMEFIRDKRIRVLEIDFGRVNFANASVNGLLLAIYRRAQVPPATGVHLTNVNNPLVRDSLERAGLDQLFAPIQSRNV